MTEHGASSEYMSFVRGFVAAADGTAPDPACAAYPDAFTAGFAAGSREAHPETYRELTGPGEAGSFNGTLELPVDDLAPLSGTLDMPWPEHAAGAK